MGPGWVRNGGVGSGWPKSEVPDGRENNGSPDGPFGVSAWGVGAAGGPMTSREGSPAGVLGAGAGGWAGFGVSGFATGTTGESFSFGLAIL